MTPRGDLFRRSIALRRVDSNHVAGSVEDDFHHFALDIGHAGGVVEAVVADAVRAPWSTCPAAAVPLQNLVGARLIERASDVGRAIDMRAQCTHLFDLAGLLLALAWRGDAERRYDAYVRDDGATREASLDRDGETVLAWRIADNRVIGDAPISLARGFREMTESLPVDQAEQAFVLRRAVFVAAGRRERLVETASPDDLGLPIDVCYSLGRDVRRMATRNRGTRIDFAATVEP